MMASLQAALRSQAATAAGNIAELISQVNALAYQASTAERYATLFYAEYDPSTRMLVYVNAGHNAPIVLRPANHSSEVIRLESGGTVVGLLPEWHWDQGKFQLENGDLFVAFTDGISEAMNPAHDLWGEQRLVGSVEHCTCGSAAKFLTHIFSAADQFASGAKQSDDMTLIVARVV